MSIVGKLASKEENSKTLAEALGTDCYQKLIETLYLPDISVSMQFPYEDRNKFLWIQN